MSMAEQKKRWGDRKDAVWLRNVAPIQAMMPYIMPARSENEAYLKMTIDLTNALEFLRQKNVGRTEDKYTLFHLIACAIVKTVTLRPKLNRFYQGARLYQRDRLSLAFVVKKYFGDEAHEALAFQYFAPDTTIDTMHAQLMKEIHQCRRDDVEDNTTDFMGKFMKLPRWLLRPMFFLIRRLDYYGKVPTELIATEPHYATVFISNLGSIGLDAAYHHLTNWGTNSVFATIGKMREQSEVRPDGSVYTHTVLDIGLTLDERIGDGYYFSKTVRLLKHLLEHPELLNERADKEVDY